MIERGGKIIAKQVDRVTREEIRTFVMDHVFDAELINTDQFGAYRVLDPYFARKKCQS